MSVRVIDNTPGIENTITQKANIFLRIFAEEVVNIARPKTPKKDNFLAKDVIKQVLALNGKIIWDKSYASYQERGMSKDGTRKVRNYTTPGTEPHYALNAVNEALGRQSDLMRKAGIL